MGTLWILADALAEIANAREWYDLQCPGLGNDFLDALEAALNSLLAFPSAYPVNYRDARRVLLERFPYCLFYRTDGEDVVVVACLHAARNPTGKRRRLRG